VRGSAFLAFGTHSAGALALVAYPIDASTPDHTRNLFPGIASTFARWVLAGAWSLSFRAYGFARR
jgi:hypothetical protein